MDCNGAELLLVVDRRRFSELFYAQLVDIKRKDGEQQCSLRRDDALS